MSSLQTRGRLLQEEDVIEIGRINQLVRRLLAFFMITTRRSSIFILMLALNLLVQKVAVLFRKGSSQPGIQA